MILELQRNGLYIERGRPLWSRLRSHREKTSKELRRGRENYTDQERERERGKRNK